MGISRKVRAVLCAGSVAALCFSAAAAQPTGQERAEAAGRDLIGTAAPAFVVQTIDGDTIDLSALYARKAVYLKFWATWCGPCRAQMPHFERAYETAGPDLAVIGVNTGFNDSLAAVRDVIRDDGLKMPTVIDDGRLAAAFNLRVTPQHIVIGRDGRIEYVGQRADERLEAALRAAQSAPLGDEREPASTSAPPRIDRYALGDALPDLTATTLGGTEFRARNVSDPRPTVLVFLSPWCETYYTESRPELSTSCKQVREQVTSLASRGVGDRVRWLGVASGIWSTPDELSDYATEYAPGIALTLDASGEWFHSFDVMHVPTIVVANADGTIVERVEGFDAGLGAAIEQVLSSRPRDD